jgi:hypothetical protein
VTSSAAGAAAFQVAPDPDPPSAIEQAILDHDCSAKRTAGGNEAAYDACSATRLISLRADFGRDLKGLSNAERRALDTVCNRVRTVDGRDAYIGCIINQLAALSARRAHAKPATAEAAVVPSPVPASPANTPTPPRSGWPIVWWIGGGLVVVAGGAAGAFAFTSRRPTSRCRVCAVILDGAGDLCPSCRREAAEALRRAAVERAAEDQAREDAARRQRELVEEQRREQARRIDEERAQHEERLQREAQTRQETEDARRHAEEERRRRELDTASAACDPYAVLGVTHEAGVDAIEKAYRAAKAKYAPEEVEHLGDEAQAYYREKAAAVERAYETIAATLTGSSSTTDS